MDDEEELDSEDYADCVPRPRTRTRSERNETTINNTTRETCSSKEDVFDGFETCSDDDPDTLSRHDKNYQYLMRKS